MSILDGLISVLLWYNKLMKKSVTINLDIEKLPEGYYLATSNSVPGLVAQAKSFEEVVAIAEDIAETLLKTQKQSDFSTNQKIFYPLQVTV